MEEEVLSSEMFSTFYTFNNSRESTTGWCW